MKKYPKKRVADSLSAEQERQLIVRYKMGDREAATILYSVYCSNTARVAAQYKNMGLPMDDLVQEASIGFLYAIYHYNMKFQVRFSTYAAYWSRQAILDALNKTSEVIYLPRSVRKKRRDLLRESNMFLLMTGKEATPEILAKKLKMEVDEVVTILHYTVVPVPLDEEILIGSSECESEASEELLDALLSTLPENEKEVLQLRYGIGKDAALSLKETGTVLGITAERARQLEKRALHKLMHPARKKGLKDLWIV